MQWHTRLLMDPGAPGEAPPWGNSHFLFQGLITTPRALTVTNAIYWECDLSGLTSILYHVEPNYQSSFKILRKYNDLQLNLFKRKTPPTMGCKILWKYSQCKRVQRSHHSINKALLMGNTDRTLMQHAGMSRKATDIHTYGTGKATKYSSGILLCFL